MLNIQVTDDYKLTSDGIQIIIQKRHIVDPTNSPFFDAEKHSSEKRIEWKPWKYCGKIETAIDLIMRQGIFETEAKDLKTLRSEIVSFRERIEKALN